MEEHSPEPGLPARGDYVIVTEALSQVSQVSLFCIGMSIALKPGFRSLDTLKLVMNVGEL